MSYTDFGIHKISVGQIHRRPTRPKIRVGLVLHVLHGSGSYANVTKFRISAGEVCLAICVESSEDHFGLSLMTAIHLARRYAQKRFLHYRS